MKREEEGFIQRINDKINILIELESEEKISAISNILSTALAAFSILMGFSWLTQIIALFGSWVNQLVLVLTKGRKRALKTQEKKERAQDLVNEFEKRLYEDLEVTPNLIEEEVDQDSLKTEIVGKTGLARHQAYPIIAETYLSNQLSEYKKSIILIFVLCREIEGKDPKGSGIHQLKNEIRIELENNEFRFEDPNDLNEKSQELIDTYKGTRSKIKSLDNPEEKNKEFLIREFLADYLPYDYQQSILSMIEKQENINFREAMKAVFREGSLYLNNVGDDVREEIERQLEAVEEEYRSKETYLLFSMNSFAKNREDGRYDNILKSKFDFCENVGAAFFMSLHAIRPSQEYQSVDSFLEDVAELLPEETKEEAQIFAISAQIGDFSTYPKISEIEKGKEKPQRYDINLEKMKLLKTGKVDTLEIAIDGLIGKKISLTKLLGSLPLTAFIDEDLSEKEKKIMSRNYSNYKKDMKCKNTHIDSLFDWADLSKHQIESLLVEYDEEGEVEEDRWAEIADKLYENSKKIDRASTGITY